MTIRAVVTDFGGVLVRSMDEAGRRKWEHRLGLAPGRLASLVFDNPASAEATVGRQSEAAIWDYVAKALQLDAAQIAELQRDFWAGDRLDETLAGFISGLRPGILTAVLSNAWSGARRSFHEVYQIDRYVDMIFISAEEGIAKPDPAIYTLTLDRLGVRPEETIFLDDFAENVAAALALGIHALHFETTPQAIAAMREKLNGAG